MSQATSNLRHTLELAAAASQPIRQSAKKPAAVTPFRARVYLAVLDVPCGKVTTYSAIARHLGMRSPRAVGTALRRNPFAPAVPCHRVVAASSVGGFMGGTGPHAAAAKRALLLEEGLPPAALEASESTRRALGALYDFTHSGPNS